MSKALRVLANLEVPVAPQKIEGPSTMVTFLGIIIDTQTSLLRLPPDKLQRLCVDPFLVRKKILHSSWVILSMQPLHLPWPYLPSPAVWLASPSESSTPFYSHYCWCTSRPMLVEVFPGTLEQVIVLSTPGPLSPCVYRCLN